MLCGEHGLVETKNPTKVEIDELIFVMSNQKSIERKTAAIMFTDIAGYTETMSQSEQKALEMLRKKRTIIKSLIDNHNGEFVKEIGDGTLSFFSSGFSASSCAKELQKEVIKENLKVRVGIHIGDIVFENNDVYGDGVNIAARLESLAPAGGVLISRNVYDELINKDGFDGVSLGLQSLKGVGRLVEVYAIKDEFLVIPKVEDYQKTVVDVHTDEEIPSIAIIPFDNKGAEEDVFYAYGISADLISECSSIDAIRVASLKEVEELGELSFKEKAKKLFVRYVVNGTLWKMGGMFQLSIELYDTKESRVLWSDRWQENWDNLPTIKSNLSDGLLKALDIKPTFEQKNDVANTEAYEFYLKAKHKYEKRKNSDDTEIAKDLYKKALSADNTFFPAKMSLGDIYLNLGDIDEAHRIFDTLLIQEKELNDNFNVGICYRALANVYWIRGDTEESLRYSFLALEIFEKIKNEKALIVTYSIIGLSYHLSGEYKDALHYHNKNLEIEKKLDNKTGIATTKNNIGLIYIETGDFDKALRYLNEAENLAESCDSTKFLAHTLNSIGYAYIRMGSYKNATKYLNRSLYLFEKLDEPRGQFYGLNGLGLCSFYTNNFKDAVIDLEKSKRLQDKMKTTEILIETVTFLHLSSKRNSLKYNLNDLQSIIDSSANIAYETYFGLYLLLEEKSYLETSYLQIQKKADAMDDILKEKFISYPIPKQIIQDYNLVFQNSTD